MYLVYAIDMDRFRAGRALVGLFRKELMDRVADGRRYSSAFIAGNR